MCLRGKGMKEEEEEKNTLLNTSISRVIEFKNLFGKRLQPLEVDRSHLHFSSFS